MKTQVTYPKFAEFFHKLSRNELRYPWLAHPKSAFTLIIGFGLLNMLINWRVYVPAITCLCRTTTRKRS